MTTSKAPKTYAVMIDKKLRGTVCMFPRRGTIKCAGAVTIDGAPVNTATAYLKLDDNLINEAILRGLPEYDFCTHNNKDFITDYYYRMDW